MVIKDIVYADTGKTRTDGRYPQRIGSTVEFYIQPAVGECMYLSYIADNQCNPKVGVLRTSEVQHIIENDPVIAVYTLNSVYYFEKRLR
jgi:hypothetical protein